MGWASGSELAENVWAAVRKDIPITRRHQVARHIIDLFEDMDCDTIDECQQLCKDAGRLYNQETDEIVYHDPRNTK
jgi:hypothetical protein